MRIGINVGDIMTRDYVFVSPKTTIIECAKAMIKKHVGSLIVKEGQRLLGIVTEKDIIWALVKKQKLSRITARDIMARRLVTIKPSADIYDALLRMKRTKFRWLPVVVKKKVVGMLTLKDILRIEPSLFDIAIETMQIKEEAEKLRKKRARVAGEETWIREGSCEECGAYGVLYNVGGRYLCESCKDMAT